MMMKIDALSFSFAGDKYLGRSYDEIDCQAFVEKCMADVGYYRDLGGSNSWFRECIRNGWTGTPEACVREFGIVPKGALLFILEDVGPKTPGKFRDDGIGDATHMGIVTGRGDGAIHSSSSRGKVATSKFNGKTIPNGGWNRIGLLLVFDYGNSVNWILEHGEQKPGEAEGGNTAMNGTVVAENGGTVKLRQKPSTNCPYYWDIKVGSRLTIVEKGETWSKCIAGGLTGWMKNEFIQFDDEQDPEPADPGQEDDFGPGDVEDGGTVEIRLTVRRKDMATLLRIADSISWQLVQIMGGQG